jgi:hypothetical protein
MSNGCPEYGRKVPRKSVLHLKRLLSYYANVLHESVIITKGFYYKNVKAETSASNR